MVVVTLTRAERVQEAQRLRAAGLTIRQIAQRMGVSRASAGSYFSDPDLAKQRARRASYGRLCACGARTDGSNGPAAAPAQCARCTASASKVWTREAVIAAILRFADANGRPPRANEWVYANPDLGYPPRVSVYRSKPGSSAPFASWNDAIRAAGFEPIPAGRWRVDRDEEHALRLAVLGARAA